MLKTKAKAAQIWANNIRQYRETQNISQNELAKKVRRSPMAVSRYEDGTIPDPKVIDLIAKAFGVHIHELFIPIEQKR